MLGHTSLSLAFDRLLGTPNGEEPTRREPAQLTEVVGCADERAEQFFDLALGREAALAPVGDLRLCPRRALIEMLNLITKMLALGRHLCTLSLLQLDEGEAIGVLGDLFGEGRPLLGRCQDCPTLVDSPPRRTVKPPTIDSLGGFPLPHAPILAAPFLGASAL